jgi:hypothetical protein
MTENALAIAMAKGSGDEKSESSVSAITIIITNRDCIIIQNPVRSGLCYIKETDHKVY